MSRYAMTTTELAAMHFYLATAERLGHDPVAMLAGIEQHPAALLASAVDDAWIAALDAQREGDDR